MSINSYIELERAVKHSIFEIFTQIDVVEYIWGERPDWTPELDYNPRIQHLRYLVGQYTQAQLEEIHQYRQLSSDFDSALCRALEKIRFERMEYESVQLQKQASVA